MSEPHTLADTGGLLIAEDGRRVLVIDRQTGVPSTVAYVLGLLTLIFGGFGLLVLISGMLPRTLGAMFLAVGLLLAVPTGLILRGIRRQRSRPLSECAPIAVLDRQSGLFSCLGEPPVPLHQVRFERRMQIGSSAPKLVAVTPVGVRMIKRGNFFDGGVGRADRVLNAVVRGG